MSTAAVAGTPERPTVTAPVGPAALEALSARIDQSLPVGNEAAGLWWRLGRPPPRRPARKNGGHRRRCDVHAVPSGRRVGMSCLTRRGDGKGRRVVVRQSFDRTGDGRNHATRRSFRSGAHRCGVESWPDAGEDLRRGRHTAGKYRPQTRATGAAEVAGRRPCLQYRGTDVLEGSRGGVDGDVGDVGLRRDRWGNAGGADSGRDGGGGQCDRRGDSRYGSTVHKQVYIYGGLDTGPTVLTRNFGMAWGVGGWLLTPFLQTAGADTIGRLQARVAAGLTTTFASTYTRMYRAAGMLAPMRSTVTSSGLPARNSSSLRMHTWADHSVGPLLARRGSRRVHRARTRLFARPPDGQPRRAPTAQSRSRRGFRRWW